VPILFYLPGDIPVYASPILIGLGGTIGLAWIAWRTPTDLRIRYLNADLWTLLGALLGGRIFFVSLNWSYFQLHASEIPLFFLGGFSWVGAYLGGITSLLLIASLSNHKLGPLSDSLFPLLGTLTVSAWLACWLDGCAYGRSTTAWWGLAAKDGWGLVSTRMPTQLLAALGSTVWTWFLVSGPIRMESPGATASLSVFGYALIALLMSFLRDDPSRTWFGLRLDTWGSIVLISISALAFLIALLKGRQNPQTFDSSIPPD
jgi:phosphatidylglycerol:prolipoprotein diacylglycerol transferase